MVYQYAIKGLTVCLRSVEESDAEVTFRMRSDPEKSRFIHRTTGTTEDQRNFIRAQRERIGDYLFLIEDLQGNPIGMKGIYNYDPVHWLWFTGAEYRGIDAEFRFCI